ncbi:MAG: lanthionine synthetase LanC family protein [Bacteroidota bacterium]
MILRSVIMAMCLALVGWMLSSCSTEQKPYYDVALVSKAQEVEPYIRQAKYMTDQGVNWRSVPDSSWETWNHALYNGTPGIALFYLELFNATGDSLYLEEAKLGADYVMNNVPDTLPSEYFLGLYVGIAGQGFVLSEAYQVTKHEPYKQAALSMVPILREASQSTEHGLVFPVTDIMYGAAGIGLFLHYLAAQYDVPEATQLAQELADGLMDIATDSLGALRWKSEEADEYFMDNFSHGTAGVAYFLSETYRKTGKEKYLKAAEQAVKGMDWFTNEQGFISHHAPGGEDLHYLSWCHGPAGTSRLFYSLYKATEDPQWLERIELAASSIMAERIDSLQTPGYWNNISKCCGAVGVAEYLLWVHQATGKEEYLAYANTLTETVERKATSVENSLKWVQAEHRGYPEYLMAQSGLMQGSAGVGLWYLKLAAYQQGNPPRILFPDEPRL